MFGESAVPDCIKRTSDVLAGMVSLSQASLHAPLANTDLITVYPTGPEQGAQQAASVR